MSSKYNENAAARSNGDRRPCKSVFCRAFVRALTTPDEEVPSPTFTLVQQYETDQGELYHYDLYRLETPEDGFELGIEDAFEDGVSLIEWPSKLGAYLPWDCLHVTLGQGEDGDTSRLITVESQGAIGQRIVEGLSA